MAADAIGPKGPGTGFGLEPEALGDLIGDATATVVQLPVTDSVLAQQERSLERHPA